MATVRCLTAGCAAVWHAFLCCTLHCSTVFEISLIISKFKICPFKIRWKFGYFCFLSCNGMKLKIKAKLEFRHICHWNNHKMGETLSVCVSDGADKASPLPQKQALETVGRELFPLYILFYVVPRRWTEWRNCSQGRQFRLSSCCKFRKWYFSRSFSCQRTSSTYSLSCWGLGKHKNWDRIRYYAKRRWGCAKV